MLLQLYILLPSLTSGKFKEEEDNMFKISLRAARELSGYTVEDIAVICGTTIEDVKRYEKDTRKMPFDLVKKAKRLFHINIEQIYLGLESEYIKNSNQKRA